MKKKSIFILFLLGIIFSGSVNANYWLVIGTYRQETGRRTAVSVLTSPSLHTIHMNDLDSCKKAGEKITNDIYKPVWQMDSKWTCIFKGN